jgi:hypothetical protein
MSFTLQHPRLDSARVLSAAVLLSAAFVALDRLLLDWLAGAWRTDWIMALTMAVFVLQIGILGVICGRWIEWPLLAWLLYGWSWLLIDLQTFTAWVFADQSWWGASFQAAALFAAQLGLVMIWTMLGTARWTTRWPVGLVLGSVLFLPLIRLRYWGDNAAVMFLAQVVALGVICGVLRWQGFRLKKAAAVTSASGMRTANDLQTAQFGLRHVLIWTTALALVCGLARAIGLPFEQWTEVRYHPLLPIISSGAALGMVLIVSLWAALSKSPSWQRWSFLLLAVPVIGVANAWIDWHVWSGTSPWIRRLGWSWQYWFSFIQNERWQITWICLAGAMLFATLLFLRSQGYRLARKIDRPAP